MRRRYEERLESLQAKYALCQEYPHSQEAGLVRMITLLSGRKMLKDHGEEQNQNPDSLYDGWYAAEFEGGIYLLVEYTGMKRGCDSFGNDRSSPARVQYTILSKDPL